MAQEAPREEIPIARIYEAVLSYHSSAYVALLTIIQALALGVLLVDAGPLLVAQPISFTTLRALIALLIILVVWHRYVTESQFIWPIRWPDTFIPFLFGVFEWFLATTAKGTAPLSGFAFALTAVTSLGVVAYTNAVRRRGETRTRNIFLAVYPQAPRFADNLQNFLVGFDRKSRMWLAAMSGVYGLTIVLASVLYSPFYEWFFPGVYLLTLFLIGWYAGFYRGIEKHPVLGQYFR